jgi:hypothetical protein
MIITVVQYLTYILNIWLLSLFLLLIINFKKLKYVFAIEEMFHLIKCMGRYNNSVSNTRGNARAFR